MRTRRDSNRFVDPLGVLLNFDNTNTKLGMALWDEDTQRFPQGPGTGIAADDKPGGVAPSAVEVVVAPSYRRSSKLVFAVVGSLPTGDVHDLIAADPRGEKPDARDVALVKLGSVGAPVSALGSHDGATVMVGTTTGRVFSLNCDFERS